MPLYRVALTPERAAAQIEQGIDLTPLPPLPPLAGGRLIPYRHEADDVSVLPVDYQALRSAVHDSKGPASCKEICRQLGLGLEPGQVEGTRAKLKRLAERGWLHKTPSGTFTARA
ncbi:hypothetical protein [Nonomuraea aurantiaca]|uniref:hypothetical protein n=1 Tax=Nonomuraea aurantiaca TaxID=2878562 RepID=UPI001CD9E640|nr:hypothetical protein [Nonomuraea aurantiaca]MCA2229312.1 hypothetical protein [Nonomuraea aurantiaca]